MRSTDGGYLMGGAVGRLLLLTLPAAKLRSLISTQLQAALRYHRHATRGAATTNGGLLVQAVAGAAALATKQKRSGLAILINTVRRVAISLLRGIPKFSPLVVSSRSC